MLGLVLKLGQSREIWGKLVAHLQPIPLVKQVIKRAESQEERNWRLFLRGRGGRNAGTFSPPQRTASGKSWHVENTPFAGEDPLLQIYLFPKLPCEADAIVIQVSAVSLWELYSKNFQ